MIILRKEFSIDQILNGIKRNNLSQQFKLFRLFCPADCLEKTYKLCEEIYREFKYALSSEPSMDKMSDSFELVLIDNYPNKVLKECIDRLPK